MKILAKKLHGKISTEYSSTVDQVKLIAGVESLMEESPALAVSLQRRGPYLDPLNHIQTTLLERCRDESLGEDERDEWRNPLLRTINAIAQGMRKTG